MKKLRRLLVPALLAGALLSALAFAATASAETRAGETKAPENPAIPGKADILAVSTNYDVTAGAVTFNITTREAFGEREELSLAGVLGRPKESACNISSNPLGITLPVAELIVPGVNPAFPGLLSRPSWIEVTEEGEIGGLGKATRSLSGTTTTLTATSSELSNKPYTCAAVAIQTLGTTPTAEKPEGEPPVTLDEVSFPLNTLPSPPAPPAPRPPAPGALAFAGSKPVTAKTGKWTKVRVKVANTGGTAVGPIALKAKAPAGVIVKPGSPKLPALLGGQTWTVTLQVKLTEKAKSNSTITLTGTTGALSATGSVVIKTAG